MAPVTGEEREAGRALCALARRVRLLASVTPVNLGAELRRLGAAWAVGRDEGPRFLYAPPAGMTEVRRALGEVMRGYRGPRRALYAARVEELALEAAACESAGTETFRALARERYPRRDGFDGEADRQAERWADAEDATGEAAGSGEGGAKGARVLSDDEQDPRSLVCAMRRAVGERRLAVRVEVARRMASLAATGDGVIYVAAGRRITDLDVARTVLHEVEGHAAPAQRAKRAAVPLLELGTAFGSDDQEGRALLIEERAGLLAAGRRRELAWRHLAARAMANGAGFVETMRLLLGRGAAAEDAVRIGARVFRGGGLGREAAYLPALLRVRAALSDAPGLEAILASGRVSVEAARDLAVSGGPLF